MDSSETPKPKEEEIGTSQKDEIEQIGQKAIKFVEETPPTKRPDNGQSDVFWSTPSVVTRPGLIYGDIRVHAPVADAHGATCVYSRPILNENGEKLGTWKKRGYYLPYQDQAVWLQEELNLSGETTKEEVRVFLNKATEEVRLIKVGSVERTVSQKPDYNPIRTEELSYTYDYDNNGELLKVELLTKDPITGRVLHKKEIFSQPKVEIRPAQVQDTNQTTEPSQPVYQPIEQPRFDEVRLNPLGWLLRRVRRH